MFPFRDLVYCQMGTQINCMYIIIIYSYFDRIWNQKLLRVLSPCGFYVCETNILCYFMFYYIIFALIKGIQGQTVHRGKVYDK